MSNNVPRKEAINKFYTNHPPSNFFKEILASKCATSPLSANYYSCLRTLNSLVSMNVYARHD